MKKKLPNVFAKSQDKKIDNNKEFFYIREEDKLGNEKKDSNVQKYLNEVKIKEKIKTILSSSSFVYKIKVLITTDEEEFKETIIATTNKNILTLDNKLIPINTIRDIKII